MATNENYHSQYKGEMKTCQSPGASDNKETIVANSPVTDATQVNCSNGIQYKFYHSFDLF